MTTYLDPKTGATIGYQATKGTTAEPFQVPMAWQPSTLSYVSFLADAAGNLLVNGAAGGGGAVTIANGSDVAEGSTTDAAVTTDVAGTVSAKLRGLVKIFGSAWDSTNGRINVAAASNPEALVLDVSSSTISYLGKSPVGTAQSAAAWKISRLTSASSGGITIEYAGGAATYVNVWTNRASFAYS